MGKNQIDPVFWGFQRDIVNLITIRTDMESEMAEVWVNEKCVYTGNFWDYHPGCHGITAFDFQGPSGFAAQLTVLALQERFEVDKVKRETYSCEF